MLSRLQSLTVRMDFKKEFQPSATGAAYSSVFTYQCSNFCVEFTSMQEGLVQGNKLASPTLFDSVHNRLILFRFHLRIIWNVWESHCRGFAGRERISKVLDKGVSSGTIETSKVQLLAIKKSR